MVGWAFCSLEIGAGGGLVGLAVAKGCVVDPRQPLYITDQLEMFSLMQHNVVLNEVEGRVTPLILNWCVSPQVPPSGAQRQWAFLKAYSPLHPVTVAFASFFFSFLWTTDEEEILFYGERKSDQLAGPKTKNLV